MDYKICKMYDSEAQQILNGLRIAEVMNLIDLNLQSPTTDEKEMLCNLKDLSVSDVFTCSYCNVSFSDVIEQRNHYKLDWHRYNLKRILNGHRSLSEKLFLSLEDDTSCMSSSDTEISSEESGVEDGKSEKVSEENNIPHKFKTIRHTKVFFENKENQILSIYRCLLHSKKETLIHEELVNIACDLIRKSKIWLIVMLGGGHFAAAIFNNGEITHNKTFHCYTVRAKQGSSQSTRDNKGGNHPKSAGASLRRYNEQALIQHVQKIISGWFEALKQCNLILYRAAGPSNRSTLFGGKNPPLCKTDQRLRNIPFPTKRPSFKEVKRVHDVLASIEIYGSADDFKNKFPKSSDRRSLQEANKSTAANEGDKKESAGGRESKSKTAKGESRIKSVKKKDLREEEMMTIGVNVSESSSGEEESVDLTWNECEIGFDHLQEYEDTIPQYVKDQRNNNNPSGSKKKRKKSRGKRKAKFNLNPWEETFFRIQSNLVDSCKGGDKASFAETLNSCSNLPGGKEIQKGKKSTRFKFTREDFVDCLNTAVDEESENTLLHLAALECLPEFVTLLLEAGADPGLRNKKNLTPYHVAGSKETEDSFRAFAASSPGKCDFKKAEIPVSLGGEETVNEVEERGNPERKAGEREEEDEGEKEERERFLALSDREKRALAAERRLVSSATSNSKSAKPPVLSRCFQCGLDITGKIPFEYGINRFCSVSCVKGHRAKTNSYAFNK